MGKPFVAYQEREPQSPLSSHDVSNHNGKLDSVGTTLMSESAPPQDALQVAESYFQQVRNSSSRNSIGSHGPQRTLFQSLQDETQESTEFVPTLHRKSIGDVPQMISSKLPIEVKSRASPDQWDIDLEASPSEFSLDDSDTSPDESMFSPRSAKLGSTISPGQANSDLETPSEFSLDDSDTSPDETICSPQIVSGSDRSVQENEMIVQDLNIATVEGLSSQSLGRGVFQSRGESVESASEQEDTRIEESEQHVHDIVSKAEFEWRGVLRRSGRSLDSISRDSFKTSMRAGTSSTNSRYSLSDEAISERAAAWGNGVARLVLKNSSRESTPRTSTASSVDGLHYGQKVPGVSKHIKDALTSVQLAFVVCDVIDPEKPVLFASAGFFDMTGYSPEEVIGRNCRFLQGVDTDAKEVARITTALKKGESYSGTILNYKKNGTPFWNLLTLSPINDDKGVVIKYMGMQAEVKSNSMMARQKKRPLDTNCKDTPSLMSQPIAEETSQPNSQSKRSERGDDVPIFTLPSTSRVTATDDSNGRSQGSKRYSLTYGTHDRRNRSVEFGPGRTIGRSERYSMPSERKRSLAPQQRPAKSNSARPFYWLLTAARILEEEIHQLGSNQNVAEEHTETTLTRPEERKDGLKKKNKISRVAKGVFGLFRKLERKVFKRTSRAPISSNRVNAYESESDSDIDDSQDIVNMNDICFERQYPGCESMPHISSIRCESMPRINLNVVNQAELRTRSNRYFPSSTSGRSDRRTSASNINELVLDRKQFCIVHE